MRKCDGVTKAGRMCRRGASVVLVMHEGPPRMYCLPHYEGAGAMVILKPFPWEVRAAYRYDRGHIDMRWHG